MDAWSDKYDIKPSNMMTMLADPTCAFTKALDLEMTDPGPLGVLGNVRCKRFAGVFDDGVLKQLYVSEAPGDPAGDDNPKASMVENVLANL